MNAIEQACSASFAPVDLLLCRILYKAALLIKVAKQSVDAIEMLLLGGE